MERLLIAILKQGTIAFIGCKITRAIGQREISEMISAGGWAILGITLVDGVIIPAIKWVEGAVETVDGILDKIESISDVFR